ncbi:MAG TPA: hypothetical protein VFP12_10255 [Allosphingosinicella sp.]|nr:hypothetical protein [Allosphingosinicella sp.]
MNQASPAPRSLVDIFRKGREEQRLHLVAALAVAAYAWTLHGLIGGILTFSTIVIAAALTNLAIAAVGGGPKLARISRWAWLLAVLAALVIIGRPAAERDCEIQASPFWSLPQLAFCDEDKEAARRAAHPRPRPHEHLP